MRMTFWFFMASTLTLLSSQPSLSTSYEEDYWELACQPPYSLKTTVINDLMENQSDLNKTLIYTQELNLTDVDFDKDTQLWDTLCKSKALYNLRVLDISTSSNTTTQRDVNKFLFEFIKNKTLNSLFKIKALGTNITYGSLENIRNLVKTEKPFIRDMEQISARYDCPAVTIEVDISGTDLAKKDWYELRNLEKPIREVDVFYRAGKQYSKAQLKLAIKTF